MPCRLRNTSVPNGCYRGQCLTIPEEDNTECSDGNASTRCDVIVTLPPFLFCFLHSFFFCFSCFFLLVEHVRLLFSYDLEFHAVSIWSCITWIVLDAYEISLLTPCPSCDRICFVCDLVLIGASAEYVLAWTYVPTLRANPHPTRVRSDGADWERASR